MNVSVAIMQLEVSAKFMQAIFIEYMHAGVSVAITQMVFSEAHYAHNHFYCNYASDCFCCSYVCDSFK